MKNLVRVSLFVLMALTLSLAIGCKHDSDPEPVKEGSRTPFVGTWVDESGDITCMIDADGTFVTHVTQAGEKYEGKYHVSPDGKTVTATITEVTFTLTSKSEDTLELTLPENLSGKKVTLTKKVNADFAGEWMSTDGSATATLKDGNFTTVMGGQELKGTYTVDGKTATTSKMEIPAELAGGSAVPASFIMKMVDGNDVMKLTATHGEPFEMTFVKVSTKEFDLTGTWTGEVPDEEGALGEATIVVTNNSAVLTLPGQQEITATVTQNGNFFTITWGDDHDGGELPGLISDSGKAWVGQGVVLTKK